ncbi:3'-5' exonuclease [Rubritalea sp.]|uniref:3'-5' exonuclease n=1 Tax=Rubritalea sp. TaxID=2109375 RepID=UPI003EF5A1CC
MPKNPTKAETALLPPFQGISSEHIYVPETESECQAAVDAILSAGVAGFDTEAKPTFRKGQKSEGPHVVQFSLTDRAYIFQLYHDACEQASARLITSKHVLKVGFGLSNDHGQIRSRLGVALNNVLDLDQTFCKLGYQRHIGVRGAIGAMMQQCFKKSKAISTSDWAIHELSQRQLLYAANDAYAALKIMEDLQEKGHL